MKPKILIVEDDSAIAKLVATCLREGGYSVIHAPSADAGFAVLRQEHVDLILMDISLPGISGLQALQFLKEDAQTRVIPVMMLTSHAEESFKVKGLKTGADDYVVKPFSLKELLARIEALLRRVHFVSNPTSLMTSGEISVDLDKQLVRASNECVNLTQTEYECLRVLMAAKGRVMTYRVLASELSDGNRELTSESVYQFVKNLRRKLGRPGESIETVYGVGYRFAA